MSAHGRRVLLLGGTSEIGLAIVAQMARTEAVQALLAGRDGSALERAAEQMRIAGATSVSTLDTLDAAQPSGHEHLIATAFDRLGGVDVAILAVGLLGERGGLPQDIPAALEVLDVNVRGTGSLLMRTAERMQAAGGGKVIVLSSVAAQRPRRTNAVYGASKAGIDALAQGLSDALAPAGVQVMVVRPGFVHTAMTAGLPVPPLACQPQDVARATLAGLERGAQTVWAPPAMRWVMLVLRMLPRPIFRRLSL
jgi:decaprenylphospho-beta-D-erythro-pentofuranosid-2-ulose 2-reductase